MGDAGVLRIADLEVTRNERRVLVRGREVPVTTREYAILETLASHPGWVFNSDQLSDQDARGFASPSAVNVHVSHLRTKLAAENCSVTVQAVRGAGYRLAVSPGGTSPLSTTGSDLAHAEEPSYLRERLMSRLKIAAEQFLQETLPLRVAVAPTDAATGQIERLLAASESATSMDELLLLLAAMNCEVDFTLRFAEDVVAKDTAS